jgi:hypothetical protein
MQFRVPVVPIATRLEEVKKEIQDEKYAMEQRGGGHHTDTRSVQPLRDLFAKKEALLGIRAPTERSLATTTMPVEATLYTARDVAAARESGAAEARAEAARVVALTRTTEKLVSAREKLGFVQFEWEAHSRTGRTTETESDMKERLSTIADGITREWAFGPTGNGQIHPLRVLLSDIHMLLPEADGWMSSSSSTDSSIRRSLEAAKNNGDVDRIFKQVILHTHTDKIASEDIWSRVLKESIVKRLNESRGALGSE